MYGVRGDPNIKRVTIWEEHVRLFLAARAPQVTALFNPGWGTPSGSALRRYMEDRLNELRTIHAQL
jgi:hypothetical protein